MYTLTHLLVLFKTCLFLCMCGIDLEAVLKLIDHNSIYSGESSDNTCKIGVKTC